MTDTYETWFKVGRMNNILDNLIAQGEAKRMIVVMPYANPYPELILQGKEKMYNPMDTKRVADEITKDVIVPLPASHSVAVKLWQQASAIPISSIMWLPMLLLFSVTSMK